VLFLPRRKPKDFEANCRQKRVFLHCLQAGPLIPLQRHLTMIASRQIALGHYFFVWPRALIQKNQLLGVML
jgi:hypothetical protein